jgi:Asp-tRNA(Asn)/Glu-tRNA(Gln) amidotransferase C subunit
VARISSKDVNSRINEAIGRLVGSVYNKLSYIEVAMNESDIRKMFISTGQTSLNIEGDSEPNVDALNDVYSFIARNSIGHTSISMKGIKERYLKAPYGFVDDDIHWLVARLFKRGDLRFIVNGVSVTLNNKSEDDIINLIIKKANVEKLLIGVRDKVNDKDKQAVRRVMGGVFNDSFPTEDEDRIMNAFQEHARRKISELARLEPYYEHNKYPGKKVIERGKKLMTFVSQEDSPIEFFREIANREDDFIDFAEDYEPVESFFSGKQLELFDQAVEILKIYEDSKVYITDEELEKLAEQMYDIVHQENPYSNISKLPDLREKFMDGYVELFEQEGAPVEEAIEQYKSRVLDELSKKEYAAQKKEYYTKEFDEILDGAKECNNIGTLRSYSGKAETLKNRFLEEMDRLDVELAQEKAARLAEEVKEKGGEAPIVADQKTEIKIHRTKRISIKEITGPTFWELNNADDIEKHIDELRQKIIEQIDEDTTVYVEF